MTKLHNLLLKLTVVCLTFHSEVLLYFQVSADLVVEQLWDSDTASLCTLENDTRKSAVPKLELRGTENQTCSVHIFGTSYVSILLPAAANNDFFVYISREGTLGECTNQFLVIDTHGQPNCSVMLNHGKLNVQLQGNVSVVIMEQDVNLDFTCPEESAAVSNDDNNILEPCLSEYVRGYSKWVTCIEGTDVGICAIVIPSVCDVKLGNREVEFVCKESQVSQKRLVAIFYPLPLILLDLSMNNILLIEANAFRGLGRVQILNLELNMLQILANYTFVGLEYLESLMLHSNRIKYIHEDTFQGLTNLKVLDLHYNNLQTLEGKAFGNLLNLEVLALQANVLISLPEGVFVNQRNLNELYLHYNPLDSVPETMIRNMTQLSIALLAVTNIRKVAADFFFDTSKLKTLYLSYNQIEMLDGSVFQSLSELIFLDLRSNKFAELPQELLWRNINLNEILLSYNQIELLDGRVFQSLSELIFLDLRSNRFTELPQELLWRNKNLNEILLSENPLVSVHPNLLHGLSKLTQIQITDTKLQTFPSGLFSDLTSLQTAFFTNNQLTTIPHDLFHGLYNIQVLALWKNSLSEIHEDLLKDLSSLEILTFRENQLSHLSRGVFFGLKNLIILFLEVNRLSWLYVDTFRDLSNLTFLVMSDNNFQDIPDMKYLKQLNFLNIRNNPLRHVTSESFSELSSDISLEVSQHEVCECYTPAGFECSASSDRSPYLTCDRLLSDRVLVAIMWIIGLNALCGNAFVLIWREITTKKSKVQDLLLSNLALSDFLMGVYMITIASADVYFGERFPMQSEKWRSGIACRLAGAIGIISSEASVFFVTLISIDRFISIRFPLSVNKIGRKSALLIICFTWVLSAALGVVPSVLAAGKENFQFYDNSHVCIGLPLALTQSFNNTLIEDVINIPRFGTVTYTKYTYVTEYEGLIVGMYFSTAVFLGLNCICYLIILGCYICIVLAIQNSSKRSGRSREMKEQIKLTTKVTIIVATDFLCWFPIIVMGILVQTRVLTLPPSVYAWAITFILPINSAINPYLYTIGDVISARREKNEVITDKSKNTTSSKMSSVE